MKISPSFWKPFRAVAILGVCVIGTGLPLATNAGVTIITHGLNGNTNGWIKGMAQRIPQYEHFLGTNHSTYSLYFVPSGSAYLLTSAWDGGSEPLSPESGEIIVKLDWHQLADGNSYNTYEVAAAVVPALLSTNFIPELGGHALAEFPIHIIGHSRGGSLACEISQQLGTNGIWIDHLTTLDPHPLNNDGFSDFLYSAVDAPARTYVNVLFHDNYWQQLDLFVYGKALTNGYDRQLSNLDGGYSGLGGAHSDVHLWYHGTLDWRTPATDTEKWFSNSQRQVWWKPAENQGCLAGFYYSLIGGGDRTSTNRPVGGGYPAIREGFNQWWDLGIGVSSNRTALATNNGNWPSLLKFNRSTTNQVVQGETMPVTFYYQWARTNSGAATLDIYLDDDLNPLNTNQTAIGTLPLPGTGATFVGAGGTNLTLFASNAPPGLHTVLAKLSGAGRIRYLYAPEWVEIIPPREPPQLDITMLDATHYQIGVNGQPGQTVVLQFSTDLQTWSALATNTLATNRWDHVDVPSGELGTRYYRGLLR